MFWILLILLVAGYLYWKLANVGVRQSPKDFNEAGAFVLRMGRSIPADETFNAWTSGDLGRMVNAVDTDTNPIDRHFLLQGIAARSYKDRDNPKMRRLFHRIAEKHLAEFPDLAKALRTEFSGDLPRVTTFQHLATVLTEEGKFKEAIRICEAAMEYGLSDGTKSGYEGRIRRIQKKEEPERKSRAVSRKRREPEHERKDRNHPPNRSDLAESMTVVAQKISSRGKARYRSSRPGEFHPEALTEPCVSLSTHTALACHEPTTSRW